MVSAHREGETVRKINHINDNCVGCGICSDICPTSALIVGASLAITGMVFQGVFRNPLVSSYILGVSAGSGFGAALAILTAGSNLLFNY